MSSSADRGLAGRPPSPGRRTLSGLYLLAVKRLGVSFRRALSPNPSSACGSRVPRSAAGHGARFCGVPRPAHRRPIYPRPDRPQSHPRAARRGGTVGRTPERRVRFCGVSRRPDRGSTVSRVGPSIGLALEDQISTQGASGWFCGVPAQAKLAGGRGRGGHQPRDRPVLRRFPAAICSPKGCLTLQWRGWDSGRSPVARGVENGPSGCGKEPRSLI